MVHSGEMIGVMDSGVGGVSVLKALKTKLPYEQYFYLSDTANSPYGTKTPDEICSLVEINADILRCFRCKAIVVACNTATAVAIDKLRSLYTDIPIIGLEPAVRPALCFLKNKLSAEDLSIKDQCSNIANVLVLATPVTLSQSRFIDLCKRTRDEITESGKLSVNVCNANDAVIPRDTGKMINVYPLPAQKIVKLVECGMANSPEMREYLDDIFAPYENIRFDAVVLGCTHFPFAKKAIASSLGYRTVFFDGGDGAAEHLSKRLSKFGLKSRDEEIGNVIWYNESGEHLRILRSLFYSNY